VLFVATDRIRTGKGVPDDLKVDRNGNLFAAGPGGLHVFARDATASA
jgi:gluconolactonase